MLLEEMPGSLTRNDLFIHEDLLKFENRINVSLFGALSVAAFREWILDKLDLPPRAVVYPTSNVTVRDGSIRPDYVVRDGDSERRIGWVEVECWSNLAQLTHFRERLPERVIAIWERHELPADLGLDEVAQSIEALDLADRLEQLNISIAPGGKFPLYRNP
jgi:hypothetical protein